MRNRLPAFDVLVDMARNDPDGLEQLRRKLTERIIERADGEEKRNRLRGLQFRVNMERKRSRTHLQATIRISEMMCRSLAQLHRSMVTPLVDETRAPSGRTATLLSFPPLPAKPSPDTPPETE